MKEWRYAYAGMQVASQVELPEWVSFAATPTAQEPDVSIKFVAPTATDDCAPPLCTANATQFSFLLPGVGHYCIYAGREIVVTPCSRATADELRLFLLGSAWGALGYQRGWFPLHASVVQIGDSAVAFCAPSGGGKSSLAAWLVNQNYVLVSDDLCRVDVASDRAPSVWPSAPRLKLWRDALAALHWQEAGLSRDHMRLDKFYLSPPTTSTKRSAPKTLPLHALYVLAWGEPCIQRLRGLRAVHALIEAVTYRPEFVTALGKTAPYWQQCIELASHTPIFLLRRPREWAAMADVERLLRNHWETILSL